jgi:hypothetical protein
MSTKVLPKGFERLERFAGKWSVAGEFERLQQREGSSLAELQDFYDTMKTEIDRVMEHLQRFKMGNMPEETVNLYRLGLSFMEVGFFLERVLRTNRNLVFPLSRLQFDSVNVF